MWNSHRRNPTRRARPRRVRLAVAAAVTTAATVTTPAAADPDPDPVAIIDGIAGRVDGLAELLDTGAADTAETHPDADTATAVDDGDRHLDVPVDARDPVTFTTTSGTGFAVTIPATTTGRVDVDGTVTYPDVAAAADLVVQPQTGAGARMIIIAHDPAAPLSYDFTLTPLGDTTDLELHTLDDGTVIVTGHTSHDTASTGDTGTSSDDHSDDGHSDDGDDGEQILAVVPPAWAYDATGTPIPATYTTDDTTVTLTIHPSPDTTWPIIADPWWNPFSWRWSKVWGKMRQCGAGALLAVIGKTAQQVSMNVARMLAAKGLVKVTGGIYAYVGFAVGGCIVNMLRK